MTNKFLFKFTESKVTSAGSRYRHSASHLNKDTYASKKDSVV